LPPVKAASGAFEAIDRDLLTEYRTGATQFNGYTNFINNASAARISNVIAGHGIIGFPIPRGRQSTNNSPDSVSKRLHRKVPGSPGGVVGCG